MKGSIFILSSVLISLFFACNKAGKGGSATIKGKIITELLVYNTIAGSIPVDTFEAQDERVYIIYGDNETIDDDTKTTYNGNFKFDFLYEGDYTIYLYSECVQHIDSCPSGNNTILKKITINSINEVIELPDIIIQKYK